MSVSEKPTDPAPEPSAPTRTTIFQGALILGGLAALALLAVEMRGLLNPLLVGVVGTVLLWPLREHRVVQAILLAGGLLVLVWLVSLLGGVLLPFLIVYLLAYFLDPVVEAAQQRWKAPRWATSLGLTLVAVGVLVAFLIVLVPKIIGSLEALANGVLANMANVQGWILDSALVTSLDEAGLVERSEVEAQLTAVLPGQLGGLIARIPDTLQTLTRSVSSILNLVTTVVLVPVLLFYTLKDYPLIERNLIGLFPTVQGRRTYLTKAGKIVGSYLRGQLLISGIAAFNISVALTLLGVPFALLIGLLGGFLNMIPNVGAILTNVVGIVIALIFGEPIDAVFVLVVLFGQQLLEATVLSPNIMSHQVGLHPVLVILSLLVFGATMGFIGLLIAVPLTALIVTFYQTYREEMTLDLSEYAESDVA